MQPQGLAAVGGRLAEGHPVGQGLKVGPAEVHLELITGLGMEARMGVDAGDVGVDVQYEHGAALAGKHVQIVDIQLAVLSRQRRIQVMGHGTFLSLADDAGGVVPRGLTTSLR